MFGERYRYINFRRIRLEGKQVPLERHEEDWKRVDARRDFKRVQGQQAIELVAKDVSLAHALEGRTRRQIRGVHRAAVDFAVVGLYGTTAFEDAVMKYGALDPIIERNKERLTAVGFGEDVDTFVALAKTASQTIVANYKK